MAERGRLFSYIWAIVGDAHLAEDVFQDVSLFAVEKGGDVTDEPQFRVWLRRTARFKSLEAIRRLKRRPAPLDDSVLETLEEYWIQYDATPDSDLVEMLRECIRLLAPNRRKLMVLRYVKDMRTSQIAKRLDRQVTAISRTIARAHQNLYDCVNARLAAMQRGCDDE
jgi:RNA polymerase sigma-70 factor (ECF subfamily)